MAHGTRPHWRLLVLLACALGWMSAAAAADGKWEGEWRLTRLKGGEFLLLSEANQGVTGTYRNGRGSFAAKIENNLLRGTMSFDGDAERFVLVLSPDGQSFSGYDDTGGWLRGARISAADWVSRQVPVGLETPRATMRTFLTAANMARDGHPEALSWAAATIDFSSSGLQAEEDQFNGAEQLYQLVNATTFNLSSIPDADVPSPLTVSLPALNTDITVDVMLRKTADQKWLIELPNAAAIAAKAQVLAAKGHGPSRAADKFRELQTPRDTLRSFLDGMANWSLGGDQQAIDALDLDAIPQITRHDEGRLVSEYLVRVIDRVGLQLPQSIPNDGEDREPFVYFDHPAGRIVIGPVGNGDDTKWKFTAETVEGARKLFRAVQDMPETHALDPRYIPPSLVLSVRQMIQPHAPVLVSAVGSRGLMEYWQLIAALVCTALIAALMFALQRLLRWVMAWPQVAKYVHQPKPLALATVTVLGLVIVHWVFPLVGVPAIARQYGLPVVGTMAVLLMLYAAWQVVGALFAFLEERAERTESQMDDILLSFLTGIVRLIMVIAAAFEIGALLSLPTTGILAGLSIGGLAMAIASKETLSNIFGAGILLGDRPFQKGDRIVAGEVNGWVEEVGLRSTRIRTMYDSLLIVPNGKLADSSINNFGARRRRTLLTSFPVTSGGTPEALSAFTSAVTERIASDPMYEPGQFEVNVKGITFEGIQVELYATLTTRSGHAARAANHRLFLDIVKLARAGGMNLGVGTEMEPHHTE